jgi:16S rRNA (guanine527-N7)-methyltransferase
MQEFVKAAKEILGIHLQQSQIDAFLYYESELLKWNERFNLTAIQEPGEVRVKHFLDSLSCLLAMRNTTMRRVIDVGSGAGFPGIPLKMLFPTMQMTLVESIGKKANFCEHIVKGLGLEGVEVINARAETVGRSADHREMYDWALARAVASLPTLVEYLLPLVRVGGMTLAQKGESGPSECQEAELAIELLGGHLQQLIPVHLPGVAEDRYLIVIDKISATAEKFPRRVGVPTKKPL